MELSTRFTKPFISLLWVCEIDRYSLSSHFQISMVRIEIWHKLILKPGHFSCFVFWFYDCFCITQHITCDVLTFLILFKISKTCFASSEHQVALFSSTVLCSLFLLFLLNLELSSHRKNFVFCLHALGLVSWASAKQDMWFRSVTCESTLLQNSLFSF